MSKIKNRQPNPTLDDYRQVIREARESSATDDPLTLAAADALELLVYLCDAGVLDLPLAELPEDAEVRLVRLGETLRTDVQAAVKVSQARPVDESKRQTFADHLHQAARTVIDGEHSPQRLEREVALMLDTMASHVRLGAVEYTGMLPHRIGQVADALLEPAVAESQEAKA